MSAFVSDKLDIPTFSSFYYKLQNSTKIDILVSLMLKIGRFKGVIKKFVGAINKIMYSYQRRVECTYKSSADYGSPCWYSRN